jgi:peptide deformylase
MALLPILEAPHPLLKTKASPVESFDARLLKLLEDMLETMYKAPGVGLAAPQVGVTLRALVVDVSGKDEPKRPIRIINPEIVWHSADAELAEEGCLSLPEQYAEVRRPRAVKVRYQDETGAPHEIEADGLLARCLQHEIDHLDGILFTDHLSKLKRDMIMRRLAKARRLRA